MAVQQFVITSGGAALGKLSEELQELVVDAAQAVAAFEQMELRLETVTGSADAAEAAFQNIKALARTAPLEIGGMVTAFIDLHQAGISPTNDLLLAFGNIAASFDRDIEEVSAAAIAAAGGQADALRAFGIDVQTTGETLRITVGDQVRDVENNAAAIIAALQGIGETEFADGLERQSRTVEGSLLQMRNAAADTADETSRSTNALGIAAAGFQAAATGIEFVREEAFPTLAEQFEELNRRIGEKNESLAANIREFSQFPDDSMRGRNQAILNNIRRERDDLVARRDELRSQLEELRELHNETVTIPSSQNSPDAAAFGEQGSGELAGGPAGLTVVPRSETDVEALCDCLASLTVAEQIPASELAPGSSLIEQPGDGESPGAIVPVTPETVETLKAADKAASDYADSVGDIAEQSQTAQELSQLFGNAAGNAMAQLRDGSFSAADAVQALIDQLIQLLIIDPFVEAITGFFEGVFSPSGSTDAAVQSDFIGTATTSVVGHTGGVIGATDLPTRLVSASAAGLAADEVPAILRSGEGVFTPEQMAALAPAGGGGDVTVNVIDQRGGDKAPVEVTERQSNGRREIEVLIVDTVTRNIGRRGSVGQAIETVFGARRQGVR